MTKSGIGHSGHWSLIGHWVLVIGYFLTAGCSQFKRLSPADRLNPEEKLDYLVLSSIDEAAAHQYATLSIPAGRADFLDWFWQHSPAAPGPLRREEYYQRAREARGFFGAVDLLGDDRVRTYVRFGPPRREAYEPSPVTDETVRVIVNPAEIWTYSKLGYQFDFVRTGTAFKLVGETRFGPAAVAPALEEVDLGRPAPRAAPEARALDLAIGLARFRQQGDSVEVGVHFGVPAVVLTGLPGRLLFIRIRISPRGGPVAVAESCWASTGAEPDTLASRLVVARRVYRLPVDFYDVELNAVSSDGRAAGRVSGQLNLVDYVRRAQQVSDIALYSLADSSSQGPQFERLPWLRVVPLVLPEVKSGRTFYALYELYNLGIDDEGRHQVQADYDIIEEATRRLAVVPTPTRFEAGPGADATLVERVHTMDLRPGWYILVARVRDLLKQQDLSLTTRFRIDPR